MPDRSGADGHDPVAADPDVAADRRGAGPVHDRAAVDDDLRALAELAVDRRRRHETMIYDTKMPLRPDALGRRLMRRAPSEPAARIGADIGGTFTDIAFVDGDGRLSIHKVVSTPPDFGRAVAEVVERLHARRRDRARDRGHPRDDGRDQRDPRTSRRPDRAAHDGRVPRRPRAAPRALARAVRRPLRPAAAARRAPLAARGRRARRAGRAASSSRSTRPRCGGRSSSSRRRASRRSRSACSIRSATRPTSGRSGGCSRRRGAYTSLSVDLLPVIGEYERTSTTVVNAYIGPVVSRYVLELRDRPAADRRASTGSR